MRNGKANKSPLQHERAFNLADDIADEVWGLVNFNKMSGYGCNAETLPERPSQTIHMLRELRESGGENKNYAVVPYLRKKGKAHGKAISVARSQGVGRKV